MGSPRFERELRAFGSALKAQIVGSSAAGVIDVPRDALLPFALHLPEIYLEARDLSGLLRVPERDVGGAIVGLRTEGLTATKNAERLELSFDKSSFLTRHRYRGADGEVYGVPHHYAGEAGNLHAIRDALRKLCVPNIGGARVLPAERKLLSGQLPHRFLEEGALALSSAIVDFGIGLMSTNIAARSPLDLLRLLPELIGGDLSVQNERRWFTPRGTTTLLTMEASASLVGSLAALVLYVRHEAAPGDFLIIDEPEMNAHPEAILGIAEVLAILSNAGVNVVVTTHSPYFVDHLENLMEGSSLNGAKRTRIRKKLRLQDDRALLSPEKLGVYAFEEKKDQVVVRDVLDRDLCGIDWTTFSAVSDRVQNLQADILTIKRRGAV